MPEICRRSISHCARHWRQSDLVVRRWLWTMDVDFWTAPSATDHWRRPEIAPLSGAEQTKHFYTALKPLAASKTWKSFGNVKWVKLWRKKENIKERKAEQSHWRFDVSDMYAEHLQTRAACCWLHRAAVVFQTKKSDDIMLTNEQLALKHVTLPILAVFMTLGNGALILITLRRNSSMYSQQLYVLITLRHKSLRNSVTNLFVASLALSDLLTGVVVVSLAVVAGKMSSLCLLSSSQRMDSSFARRRCFNPATMHQRCRHNFYY